VRPRSHQRDVANDRGSVTIWAIGVVVASMLMVGLVLDGGVVLRARSDAFSIASAAAREGAQQLDEDSAAQGQTRLDPTAARAAALDYLDAHGLTGTVRVDHDRITVTVTSTAHLQVLQMIGGDTVTFDATATVQAIKGGER